MKNPFSAFSAEDLETLDMMFLEAMKLRRFKDHRERLLFDEFGFILSQTIIDRYLTEINLDEIELNDISD